MCGKAMPFRQPENILRLCLVQDPRRSLGSGDNLPEGLSPSAHQTAEPQERDGTDDLMDRGMSDREAPTCYRMVVLTSSPRYELFARSTLRLLRNHLEPQFLGASDDHER
jgi:hypothetical protein